MSEVIPTDLRSLSKALGVAKKKVRILGKKALNSNLDHFCGDMAEAYACGIEEAQSEIVSRIERLIMEAKL